MMSSQIKDIYLIINKENCKFLSNTFLGMEFYNFPGWGPAKVYKNLDTHIKKDSEGYSQVQDGKL